MTPRPKHIYFISSHVADLAMYHGLRLLFERLYPETEQTLVMVGHPDLPRMSLRELTEGYDSIEQVSFHETAATNRWREEYRLGAIRKRLRLLQRSQDDLRRFSFAEDSLCFISEMSDTTPVVRLLIAKLRRETKEAVLCRVGTCFHKTYQCRTNNWPSWIENNLYALFAGAPPVAVKFYDWMIAERRFYSEHKVVDHNLVFSDRWAESPEYTEIKYPLLGADVDSRRERPYVIYLDHGTGWLSLFPEMSEERYIEATNRVLEALTDLYRGEDVDLLFKPHPRGHATPYEYAGFKLYAGKEPAEMMFMREPQAVRAVYSPVSTAVRTASMYGIPAYIFDEVFDLPEEQRIKNKSSLLDFGDVVNVQRLDELELPPIRPPSAFRSREEELDRLGDLFRDMIEES